MLEVLVAEFNVMVSRHRRMKKQLKQPTVRLPHWRLYGTPVARNREGSLCSLHCFSRHLAALLYAEARWVWFLGFPQARDLCASVSFTLSLQDVETWAPCSNKQHLDLCVLFPSKAIENTLIQKIYDSFSIFSTLYMSAKFHFLNIIEKATGGIPMSRNVKFSVKIRPLRSF